METETPTWETFKENAAPLERGRNVAVLERSCLETEDDRLFKESTVRHYEGLIRPSEEIAENGEDFDEEDDPLIHWLSYIKFHQDHFPTDKQTQFLLMERCARTFVNHRKYANDIRFVRVCVSYADESSDAEEIFRFLQARKIGSATAIFWLAWAFLAEKQEKFALAEKIFTKGMSKNAKPLHILQQRHRQFQRRMARHFLNKEAQGCDEEEFDDTNSRGVLGGLTEDAFRRNDRRAARNPNAFRSNQTSRNQNDPSSSMATFRDRSASVRTSSHSGDFGAANNHGTRTAFHVFDDNQENDAYNLDRDLIPNKNRLLPRDQDRRKENTVAAEQWNLRGGLHSTSRNAVMPSSQLNKPAERNPQEFSVFVDEACAAEDRRKELLQQADEGRQRRHRDERTFREIEAGERVVELLQKDPLRYLKDPSKREKDEDQAKRSHRIPDEKVDASYAKNPPKNERIAGRNGPGGKRGQSQKASFLGQSLITDSSGREQCFNEYRAFCGRYATLSDHANFNALHRSKARVDDSVMDIDDSTTAGDTSMEDKSVLGTSGEEEPRRVLFRGNASFDRPDRSVNVSQCSSTINPAGAVGIYDPEEETINTKLAFREMSMMFCSPATGLMQSSKKPKRPRNETGEYMSGIGHQNSFESQQPGHGFTCYDSESEEATFATVLDLVGSSARNVNNSLVQMDAFDTEYEGGRNPSSKAAESQPEIDAHVPRTLNEHNSTATSCRRGIRQPFGQVAHMDLMQDHSVGAIDERPGFTVYEDSPEGHVSTSNNKSQPLMYHDPKLSLTKETRLRRSVIEDSKPPAKPKEGYGFDILNEREQRGSPGSARQVKHASRHPPRPRIAEDRTAQALRSAAKYSRAKTNSIPLENADQKSAAAGFSIFVDNASLSDPSAHDDGDNTECLAIYNELIAEAPNGKAQPNEKVGFPIFQDSPSNESPTSSDCNTAVLSIFKDLLADEAGTNTKSSINTQKSHTMPKQCPQVDNTTASFPNFDEIMKALHEDDGFDSHVSKFPVALLLRCNLPANVPTNDATFF
jgi:checkpoint serine/threonine-protein kinase